MKKDKVLIFLVIVFCFALVNIVTQVQMNNGYTARMDNPLNPEMVLILGHREYDLASRLFPLILSAFIILIVYTSMIDKNFWVSVEDFRKGV